MAGIVILGLGPANADLITRQAWQVLETADEIYLRTEQHPAVKGFPPSLRVKSFDDLYQHYDSFEQVYQQIVEQIIALGKRPEGVIYAVPGHPFIAESTGPEIVRQAKALGIPCSLVGGLSFLEPTFSALGLDPLPHTSLVDALTLVSGHHPPFPPDAPVLIAQIYDRQIAAEVKITLMAAYPDEHPVQLVHGAGSTTELVEDLPLYAIDRSEHIGLLTSLYLSPLGPATSMEAFQELVAHLRSPEGCPWDREQDHQSLRPNLLEEAYEVVDAIDKDDPIAMVEEFGDLLLQVVLHAQIASEYGEFTMADVINGIYTKLVRRHPHVFGDVNLDEADAVIKNWERLKAEERKANGEEKKGLLDGVANALPALTRAQTYQNRVVRVGFDWPDISGVMDKICEEIEEIRTAPDDAARASEVGDLLFAIVNLARWLKIDAESALRETNQRFRTRFAFIEQSAREQGRELGEMPLEEMEELWQEAKQK
ncbi:MAG: nucleoside triphosphate pyrophosphohydrolase [Chloroflexi bacterium]|jgi:tetrapyrrole methylase family protein / MazG family protein|nr:nucleoside triphosphate pyrophosphohydrolase [Chloroflexota bacterium]